MPHARDTLRARKAATRAAVTASTQTARPPVPHAATTASLPARRRIRRWLRGLTATVAAAGLTACALPAQLTDVFPTVDAPTSTAASLLMPEDEVEGPFVVTKIVDGDTIWVDNNGARQKVRLIGLDTPETRDPRKEVQCFGIEATSHAEQLLAGQSVYLEPDPSQESVDRYGRTLSYVWTTTGQLINLEMISGGYGFEYTYDLPYKYQGQFRAAQAQAQESRRGLWSPDTCGGNTGG